MNSKDVPPLNLLLSRITPRWVRSRVWRRRLALAYYFVPALWLAVGAGLPSSLPWLAPLALGIPIISLLWLMGATGARADLPDAYLDERERGFRDRVFRVSFVLLMGVVALCFSGFTLAEFFGLELPRVPLQGLFALLFFVGLPLPTVVQAWREPDPLEPDPVERQT